MPDVAQQTTFTVTIEMTMSEARQLRSYIGRQFVPPQVGYSLYKALVDAGVGATL